MFRLWTKAWAAGRRLGECASGARIDGSLVVVALRSLKPLAWDSTITEVMAAIRR
jgi:hypothetical protein